MQNDCGAAKKCLRMLDPRAPNTCCSTAVNFVGPLGCFQCRKSCRRKRTHKKSSPGPRLTKRKEFMCTLPSTEREAAHDNSTCVHSWLPPKSGLPVAVSASAKTGRWTRKIASRDPGPRSGSSCGRRSAGIRCPPANGEGGGSHMEPHPKWQQNPFGAPRKQVPRCKKGNALNNHP